MRQIGSITEKPLAARFGAYLVTQGISCTIDETPAGNVIWVRDEDHVARAKEELVRFRSEPDHERYQRVVEHANNVANEQRKKADAIRSQTIDLKSRWERPTIDQCPASFGMMALMVFVAVLMESDPNRRAMFTTRMLFAPSAIWAGEVWRLFTPIFVHGDHFHLLFNLMAMYAFGLRVESRLGTLRFCGLVLCVTLASNFAQFYFSGSNFVGMSGVNYGLFGYAWIRSRTDPNSGIAIPHETVVMMLGWAIICVLIVPGVANWAHGGGLAAGAVLGAANSGFLRRRR